MHTQRASCDPAAGLSRRALLHRGLAAGLALSALPFSRPAPLWGAEAGPPRHGGILRVRGYDPVHFDHHLTLNARTNTTLSFLHSTLLRYQVGAAIAPGTFTVEPHLAERWEAPDDLTYVFHLRRGVKWHNKPPLHGRELVADDVRFTFDRFLSEPANVLREQLEPVERVEVVDRYTVKFVLKEPFVWLPDRLASTSGMWIIAPEVVEKFGDLKKPESAIGTGPFILERYEPNVKTVFKRNPTSMAWSGWCLMMTRPGWPSIAPGKSTAGPGPGGRCAKPTWSRCRRAIRTCGITISCPWWRAESRCAPISRRSTTCACGGPSPRPSTGRASLRRCTSGANPPR